MQHPHQAQLSFFGKWNVYLEGESKPCQIKLSDTSNARVYRTLCTAGDHFAPRPAVWKPFGTQRFHSIKTSLVGSGWGNKLASGLQADTLCYIVVPPLTRLMVRRAPSRKLEPKISTTCGFNRGSSTSRFLRLEGEGQSASKPPGTVAQFQCHKSKQEKGTCI